jgi:hypothetical protein
LGASWQWFIGVQYEMITAQECRDLLRPGRLEWKLGASQRVENMWRFKMPDLDITETPAPRALPQGDNWIFFNVDRRGAAWNQLQVQDPPVLGIKFNENLIENLNTLAGQRDLDFNVADLRGTLRLSLFALPIG